MNKQRKQRGANPSSYNNSSPFTLWTYCMMVVERLRFSTAVRRRVGGEWGTASGASTTAITQQALCNFLEQYLKYVDGFTL